MSLLVKYFSFCLSKGEYQQIGTHENQNKFSLRLRNITRVFCCLRKISLCPATTLTSGWWFVYYSKCRTLPYPKWGVKFWKICVRYQTKKNFFAKLGNWDFWKVTCYAKIYLPLNLIWKIFIVLTYNFTIFCSKW